MTTPRLALVMGDAAGIGPELFVRLLAEPLLRERAGEFDAVVSMYHDQGHIAVELLVFEEGVAVLCGLPFPVTTPAHGTAFDIVGSRRARLEPGFRAVRIALAMARSALDRKAG